MNRDWRTAGLGKSPRFFADSLCLAVRRSPNAGLWRFRPHPASNSADHGCRHELPKGLAYHASSNLQQLGQELGLDAAPVASYLDDVDAVVMCSDADIARRRCLEIICLGAC